MYNCIRVHNYIMGDLVYLFENNKSESNTEEQNNTTLYDYRKSYQKQVGSFLFDVIQSYSYFKTVADKLKNSLMLYKKDFVKGTIHAVVIRTGDRMRASIIFDNNDDILFISGYRGVVDEETQEAILQWSLLTNLTLPTGPEDSVV